MFDYRRHRPTIGVLAGWQYYWTARPLSYLHPIFRGIRQAAQELGCNLLFACGMGVSGEPGDPPRPAWLEVSEDADFVPVGPWNTDGLILINPLHTAKRSQTIQAIRAKGHPVVFVGSGEKGPTLVADNAGGIQTALQHLVEHGHRLIAFIAGSRIDMEGDTGERLRAFREGMAAFGLDVDERLIVFGRHVFEGGYEAMHQLLSTRIPFTAVLASNDESALGAIRALQEAGYRVPDDMAIIGFDDRPESALQQPALTSVQIPLFKMGYQALAMLLQHINGLEPLPMLVKVPTRLIIRESCGCHQSAVLADALDLVSYHNEPIRSQELQSQLVQRITTLIIREKHGLPQEEIAQLCQELVYTFLTSVQEQSPIRFRTVLDRLLKRVAAARDDTHQWQVAISVLRNALPHLTASWDQSTNLDLAYAMLDEARVTISAAMRMQYWDYANSQRQTGNQIERLTARLLTALDVNPIYDILARHLSEMGLRTVWVAFYEPEGDDPVAWSRIRAVTSPQQPVIRIRSRTFPPARWTITQQPFRLALIPLVGYDGEAGFVAFEAVHLDLQGAIVQQIRSALNTARLYQMATEGRRLAEEANQMKSRFLSMVSHELRTPLNLIVGMSELLLQESATQPVPLPAQVQADLKRIQASAHHLGRLIDDVLDLASSDAGQLRLTYDFVNLGEVLRAVAKLGQQMAAEKGLAWHEVIPETGPWVWGDRTRLHQVALNLIANAVKFTSKGFVSLTVSEEPGMVTVLVRDTGLGLLPEEQAIIFDEFQRSDRSVRRGYGGIGLGLTICKRLIAMHKGEIGVRSSGVEGEGSEFYFRLPTVAAPTIARHKRKARPRTRPRVMVLSVGEADERLRQHLGRRGFKVKFFPIQDSAAWLTELLNHLYSAVVFNIPQGETEGWQAIKLLKANPATQDIPILFYATTEKSGAVMELNYLTKPIELADLTRTLDQYRLRTEMAGTAHTILVVDDDPSTLDLHARIIKSQAPMHRVLRAQSGRQALEILAQTQVDLVMLDLMMPEMDGFEVLHAMRENRQTRDVPVIVITGKVLTEDDMARLNRGVATVMSKGMFSPEETLAHLEAALDRRHRLSSQAQVLVRKAMAYIHSHYADPITRDDLARYVGMSHDYLTYCFRQELGMTPIAYLNRYRVLQAQRLLLETNKTITTIALEVGFSSSSYFSRMFRHHVGRTPEAYRRIGG